MTTLLSHDRNVPLAGAAARGIADRQQGADARSVRRVGKLEITVEVRIGLLARLSEIALTLVRLVDIVWEGGAAAGAARLAIGTIIERKDEHARGGHGASGIVRSHVLVRQLPSAIVWR